MSNLLGVYWSIMHRKPEHYEFLKRLQPAVLKIMDGGVPDYQWAYANLPDALIVARDWALSEQHDDMTGDPIGTGQRHAREWDQHANRLGFDRSRTLVLGINEPRVWEQGVVECLRLYTIAFLDECKRLGLRAGAMQLSVGWPANNGTDTPPDWTPFWGVEEAIQRGNHALVLHEYWADVGPGEMWGWWGGRSLKCPWSVPIVIGECGVDMYVKDGGVAHESRGWVGRMSPERYAAELREYNVRMAADSRFVGSTVFALDYANREWASFDIASATNAILALPPVEPAGHRVHLPIVTAPVSHEDLFERSMTFLRKWEGGFQNNPEDHGNWTGGRKGVGELKGTKFGISAASYPDLDIVNLTQEQADAIYRRDYWQRSGADKLQWPACLLIFDTAVLHGVGTALNWQKEVGTDAFVLAAKRLRRYTQLDNWSVFGAGWVNRVAALLEEIGAN